MRARSGKTVLRRRARLRKLAKGYFLSRGNLYRQMRTTVIRAGAFAYRDRRAKKRTFRRLWTVRINAAVRARGIAYSQFIAGLLRAGVELDRKMLSEIAIHDPASFDQIVDLAKQFAPNANKAKAVAV
jgi:large subunit ribosomal protein L20